MLLFVIEVKDLQVNFALEITLSRDRSRLFRSRSEFPALLKVLQLANSRKLHGEGTMRIKSSEFLDHCGIFTAWEYTYHKYCSQMLCPLHVPPASFENPPFVKLRPLFNQVSLYLKR